ncbi:protein inturned-like isoform X1 [Haliotis rufescens]|uniref:protein inturned-like isoform X1 n=1 Tax=Haliotis rufescens TaxID=6454 RepID=UPI00201F9562|nr:protein inturned-like isoform X1 [Haliotis rufescens]
MFGLNTPLSKSISGGDFDSVNVILGNSSFKDKAKVTWQTEVNEDGEVFYLDTGKVDDALPLSVGPTPTTVPHPCCESSAGWCSTRNCKCSNSEDTGYSTDNDQPSPKNEKVSKKSTRFSSFLKKKDSKSSNEARDVCSEAECYCPDMESVKEVVLLVDPGLRPVGRPGETLCERLLGIIPGILGTNGHIVKSTKLDREKIVVKGFIPDGPAVKFRDIRIGDWLKCINGRDVGWSTIDARLKSITYPKKVRLKLESPPPSALPDSPCPPSPMDHQYESLLELVSGDQLTVQGGDPMGVFYMSMEGVTSDDVADQEDLVYSYPPGDGMVTGIRGMFYTLSHLLRDFVVSNVTNSSFVVNGDLVHTVYHMEGRDLMLVAVPDKWCSISVLKLILADIVRLLRFLVGSVEDALRQNKHRHLVDEIFSLLFKSISGETRSGPVNQIHNHPSLVKAAVNQNLSLPPLVGTFAHSGHVQYLPLSDEIMEHTSGILTDFEASDFVDMSDNFYGCRRSYTVLGSGVFYKGHLLCSHLSRDDLVDIHLYLSHHMLLTLTANQKVSQLVIWREIFPTRFCYDVSEINNTFGYSEPHARWFLLVVGLKHGLLAVLLEAGGCATQQQGRPSPEPFYIDQARCTLMQIQTPELIGRCEARMSGSGLPPTVSIDAFLSSTPTDLTATGYAHDDFTPRGQGLSVSSRYFGRTQRKSSIESDGSSGSGGSDGIFRSQRRQRMFPTAGETTHPGGSNTTDWLSPKVTDGAENCLFHYCSMDTLEGLYITSPLPDAAAPLHAQLIHNFYRCCTQIQAMFRSAITYRALVNQEDEPVLYPDRNLISIREQGVLFHCPSQPGSDSRRTKQSLAYWVVGRKYSRPVKQEVYVCFHESTPQNVVEMAFRLNFGLLSPG